jgi:hypothetical protein
MPCGLDELQLGQPPSPGEQMIRRGKVGTPRADVPPCRRAPGKLTGIGQKGQQGLLVDRQDETILSLALIDV